MWFTRISINNPVFAAMMMAAFLVIGLFSYERLKVDQFPDITFPVVVVQTAYPGASPESVESDVTRKIEEAVNTISGIDEISSHSYDALSVVIVQFDLSVNVMQAAQDVRDKVALIRPDLRDGVKEPRVLRYDPADMPIVTVAVSNAPGAALSTRDLTTAADQIVRKRLETVRGVGSVSIVGGVKRQVRIDVSPDRLQALSVGVDQVIRAVQNENQEIPAGPLTSAGIEQTVQVKGRFQTPDDFKRIIVARRGASNAGHAVTLDQVAQVVDGQEEPDSMALLNGNRALFLSVVKAQGENTVDVAHGIRAEVAALQKALPPGVKLDITDDSSLDIENSVNEVKGTLLEGALLTIAIVFLFLGSWRSTVITGLTLPIALIGTFAFMFAAGFTINVITLMALSLCVGLLIDDAIVVRENIVRHVQLGADHRTAALDGTKEIALAVLATTFSIVAVFLPVGFMSGIIGRFFHQFGVTVAAAVLISMFVSFTLDPMLSSIWPDPALHVRGTRHLARLLAFFERGVERLAQFYRRLLGWSLRHRITTLSIAVATFFGSLFLVPLVGTEFVPAADFSTTQIGLNTPVGTSLEATADKVRQVEAALASYPEVRYSYATINSGNAQGKNNALITVRLKERRERTRGVQELNQVFRTRLQRIAGIVVTEIGMPDGAGSTKAVQFSLQGDNLDELRRLSAEAQQRLRKIPGLVDLDASLKDDKPIVAIDVRRELASDLGVGVAEVGQALRPLLSGDAISTWRAPDDQDYDVSVRLPSAQRRNVDDLSKLMIATSRTDANGAPILVPLRQVAAITETTGPDVIGRRDLSREVEISANVMGRSPGEVAADVKKTLDEMRLPAGYRYRFGGSTKSMNESFIYAVQALVLAVIFIYMILASQFGSFLQPLAIMTSLPLTLVGVLLALLLFGSTLNMFSIIGFIMLMGLVTKNAILLVDFANQARRGTLLDATGKGHPMTRTDALLEAAHVRLRPILMTTLAMIFGMLPLALGLGEGGEQRGPLGQTVIGGVITSSLLTLVVVPVAYTVLDDFGAWVTRKWRRGAKGETHPAPPERSRDIPAEVDRVP
ncbi:efflux RND transporter permease subunit [Caballeronia sordidicola]|uniref:efflux RND transporter permease subunit n=1 Tax=Caballeronia sordidicola TaxID=196367 RepID=UPI00068D243A|nr:efflux RND transporter permease subunit [Caballeronia sordidicola]